MTKNIFQKLLPCVLLLAPTLGCDDEAASVGSDKEQVSANFGEGAVNAGSADEQQDARDNCGGMQVPIEELEKTELFREDILDGSDIRYRLVRAQVTGVLTHRASDPNDPVYSASFSGDIKLSPMADLQSPDARARFTCKDFTQVNAGALKHRSSIPMEIAATEGKISRDLVVKLRADGAIPPGPQVAKATAYYADFRTLRAWMDYSKSNGDTIVLHRRGVPAGDRSFSVYLEQTVDTMTEADINSGYLSRATLLVWHLEYQALPAGE